MKRTTILADDDLLREMQHMAAKKGTTLTSVIQDAMRAYIAAQEAPSLLSLVGIATTPTSIDHSDGRDEQMLREGAHPIYGLSPQPSGDATD